jgi:hypothetical protein
MEDNAMHLTNILRPCHKTSSNRKTWAQCWLAKENIEVKEVTKLTNKRRNYKERKTYRWKTSREEVKRETRRITIRAWSFEAKWDLEGSTLRIKKPLKWSYFKGSNKSQTQIFLCWLELQFLFTLQRVKKPIWAHHFHYREVFWATKHEPTRSSIDYAKFGRIWNTGSQMHKIMLIHVYSGWEHLSKVSTWRPSNLGLLLNPRNCKRSLYLESEICQSVTKKENS